MKFTESHEWIDLMDGTAKVGVTDYAQKELGDIVYVELPKVGKHVQAGEVVCVLESTKAAADVYSPVAGTILDVNVSLQTKPEQINQSPQREGWLFSILIDNAKELDALLDREAYNEKISR